MTRHGRAEGAVMRLVGMRLAQRRGPALLVMLAVTAAVVIVGSMFGVGVLTADRATRQTLAALGPRERAIVVNRFRDGAGDDAAADASVQAALEPLGALTEPVINAISLQPPIGYLTFFGLDDVTASVAVTSGRLPKPCDGGSTCEAIRVTPYDLGDGIGAVGSVAQLGSMAVTIVGTADLVRGLPVDPLAANSLVVLVDGVAAIETSARVASIPRSRFWIAPIDPTRTHSWMLDDISSSVDGVRRDLGAIDAAFVVRAPDDAFELIRRNTSIAAGRLVFVGSLIVAVLLAFAVFAAAVERDDIGEEYRRLRIHGARGRQLLAFVAAEAALPSIAGGIVGWLLAGLIMIVLGATQGAQPMAVLRASLLSPGAVAAIGSVAVLAAVAVGLGIHPAAGRLVQPRLAAAAIVPVAVVLAWDRLSRGRIGPAELASQAAGPGTVLLPGLVGLMVIGVSLIVLPALFRRLARAAGRAPLTLRLALLSIAREPLRPAATLTLLAFGMGAGVFALSYSATLRQGAADEAAFVSGMDLLIRPPGERTFIGSSTTPFGTPLTLLISGGAVGPGIGAFPMLEDQAVSASGRKLSMVGIEPRAIPLLRNWRSDYSPASPADLAAAIALPGDWTLPGHDLAVGTRELVIETDAHGDQVRVSAILARPDGLFDQVLLGDLEAGRHTLRAPLSAGPGVDIGGGARSDGLPAGWRVVALVATNGGTAALNGRHAGERQQADVTFHGIDGLLSPSQVIHLDVSGSHGGQLIRPPIRTDSLVFPAIVSPALIHDVDAAGILSITMGSGVQLQIRPVAVANRFPTLTNTERDNVIVDLNPLLMALNADAAGSGGPTRILLRTPDDGATSTAISRLGQDPFPPLTILALTGLEQQRADDPFAVGIVWALLVSAVAGLVLALAGIVLSSAARLRDRRSDLQEFEEQGVGPSALVRLVVGQTIVLAFGGVVAGTITGLGLGWLAAASIAVTADGRDPIPPLVLVAPWVPIVLLGSGLLIVLASVVLVILRAHFGNGSWRGVPR